MNIKIITSLIPAILAGCTVLPSVQYISVKSPADMKDLSDAFYRQRSEISITVSEEAAKEKNIVVAQNEKKADGKKSEEKRNIEVSLISKPSEYKSNGKIGIKHISDWRSSTVASITKVENTDLIKSLDVSVTDNISKSIAAYGGAIVKIIGLAAAVADAKPSCISEAKPLSIFTDFATDGDEFIIPCSAATNEAVKVALQVLPPDAMPASSLPFGTTTNYYFYSACRDARITFNQNGEHIDRTLRIADPRFVQMVQLPVKGSISSHSICGVSVKVEGVAVDNGAAIADALATQGKAIKDAIDASKK
jgi:hypothetical protein